ncbi:UDP-N-acetylmuramoyl-tripeptide--D-alanyl-D-alanine ligase [Wolbachia endosymbiont of Chironomus riparius]|uniref:UDP-N-acetylmuramoyl-tripeptide--D-alanyl-D- alanine ligase n=1 Tax=Wolbachia endosymbiont of Chironomus riparius TaxID=2883238 RepID=UPI00209C92F8|nr:UDP-N-acetylmuramoyl-tripeptide--D-alanyl-D-alanine ligase [Wolbachia endosymbiont of Chironomus riparius]
MFKWNENHVFNSTVGKKIGNWCSTSISTDTRNIKQGDLFIALKGNHFDGHDFLHEAFAKGAVAAIVSKNNYYEYKNVPLFIVKDTLKALQDMASYYIKKILIDAKVIAVTGSVGKTTTKDMLKAVLSQHGVSHANTGNLNNNIGLPLTILRAPKNCKYLILEMGMSKSGEIKELSKISSPDIAVITNIEHVHTENFSSLLDIAQAKLEVLYGMKSNGTLVLNKDNKYYDYLSFNADKNIVSFGKHQDAMICLLDLTRNNGRLHLKIKLSNNSIKSYNLHVQGEHFTYSALAVAAVMKILKLNLSSNAFESFKVTEGRGNTYNIQYNNKHICLINDSYNASPASMKASIKMLGTYCNKRKVALLGDMLELGSESIRLHTELLNCIIEYKIDKIYTVGKLMLKLHKLLPNDIQGMHFDDFDQLNNNLHKIIQTHDVILVKGSLKTKMHLVVKEILSMNVN